MRADGTAANKAAAIGPGVTKANCMSIATHNGEAFSAGDIIILCDDGDVYRDQIDVPSSGSDGNVITYQAASGDSPIISGADVISTWSEVAGTTGNLASLDFEEGNTTDWDSTYADASCSIAASTDQAAAGSYSAKYISDGNNRVYGEKTFTAAQAGETYYFRWYIYMASGEGAANQAIRMGIYDGDVRSVQVYFNTDGDGDIVSLGLYGEIEPGQALLSNHPQTITFNHGSWNCIEIAIKIDAAVGGAQLWINGTSIGSKFDLDTSDLVGIDRIRLGNEYFNGGMKDGGILYIDAVEVSDEGQIGVLMNNVWSGTLATEPTLVLVDETPGTNVASLGLIVSSGKWFWDANTLYVYYTEDPDSSATIEASIRLGGIDTSDEDYITIEGLQLEGTENWGGGIIVNGSTNIVIDNCIMTKNRYTGVLARDAHGAVTIQDSTISYNGETGTNFWYSGIHSDAGSNVYSGNTIYENGWIDWQGSSAIIDISDNTEIAYNTVYNNGETNQDAANFAHNHGIYVGLETSTGYDIHDNLIYSHGYGSGIKMLGSGSIYNNRVYDNYQGGITIGFLTSAETNNVYIYRNILYGNHNGLLQTGNTDGTFNIYIYANTFVNNYDTDLDAFPYELRINNDLDVLTMKNNIFSGSAENHHQVGIVSAQTGSVDIDYNLHHYDSNSIYYDGANRTYSYWQATLSHDANGVQSDPLFTNPGADNFTLQLWSPARTAGVFISGYTLRLNPSSSWPDNIEIIDGQIQIGAYGVINKNYQVVKEITFGTDSDGSIILRNGGPTGSIVWAGYVKTNKTKTFQFPNIVADYYITTGTNPQLNIRSD